MNQAMWDEQLEQRLVRYCAIATPSDPASKTAPSTDCQWELLRLLEQELLEMGAAEVELGEYGHLMATIPGNQPGPVIAWMAHVDTSPQFNPWNVKPLVHRDYDGSDLVLPDDPSQVISPDDFPYLRGKLGHDIVTASGASLLGADDKAGVAIVMTLAEHLLKNPEIPRAKTRLCFTPDEEIGRGTNHLDLSKLGAKFGYTLDGGKVGELCYETFSAAQAEITVTGVSIHPGYAKDKLVNALHSACQIVDLLPKATRTPETTEDRQGYIHVSKFHGNATEAVLQIILRDFELEGLKSHQSLITSICHSVQLAEPRAQVKLEFTEQYRNMRYWLEEDMSPVNLALDAMRLADVQPHLTRLRGGTDGSFLTEKGLPTPNIFAGMQNFHGPLEWVSVQDMAQSVQVCLELVQLWANHDGEAS